MDQERKRRWIQSQQQKLQDLKLRKLTPPNHLRTPTNLRPSRTEKQIKLKPAIMKHQSTMAIDDCITKGDCKLIFLQSQEDFGFKSFTDMMKTNSSWWCQMEQLNPNESTLKNRLKFNQGQANRFQNSLDQRWNSTVHDVTEQITKQYELQQQSKVKKVKLKAKLIKELEEDAQYEEGENPKTVDITSTCVKVFWFNIQISEWKPPIREGCSVTYIPTLSRCFMYGGIGNDLFKNVVSLNTLTWAWKDVGYGNGDVPLEGRFGHTATLFRQQIIIYGGERKYNSVMKMRECYSDVRLFNPMDKSWLLMKTTGDSIEGRRNHIAQCVGKYFIVHGGINSYGKILNDTCGLNLETNKWAVLQVENQFNEGVSDAASVSLFGGEVKMENPYFSYECNKKKGKYPQVSVEGIYIFGGRIQNGEAVNEIRVVQFGFKPIRVVKYKTKGQPPLARYSHSMNYYPALNSLIVYGGRNDSKEGNILNDIYMLQLSQSNWILVQQMGSVRYGKCSHCSVSIESKLLVFGGYTQNVYANADIQLIELDQNRVQKIIKENRVNNSVMVNSTDLLTNPNLRVFKTDYYNEPSDREAGPVLKRMDTSRSSYLNFNFNFKSFLPLPNRGNSQLVQDYKIQKERNKFLKNNIMFVNE